MGKPIQDMNLMELREEVLRADPGSQRQKLLLARVGQIVRRELDKDAGGADHQDEGHPDGPYHAVRHRR